MGLVLVELDAFAAGVVPDPATMDDQPGWLYRAIKTVRAKDLDEAPITELQVDLRTRRKFPGEDVLYTLILERDAAVGSMTITGLIRFLILKQ